MKFRILIFLLMATPFVFQASAQKKCKFDFEKEDPFTGEVSRGISIPIYPESPASNEYWYVGLNRTDDDFSVIIRLQLTGKYSDGIIAGDSVMFRTEAGDVVTCYAEDLANPVPVEGKIWETTVLSTLYVGKYDISAEQLKFLAGSPLTHIRMNIAEEVYEAEVKSKHGKDFPAASKCILE